MLINKDGLIVNGIGVDREDQDFARLAHSSDARAKATIPSRGVPLVADSKILDAIYVSNGQKVDGKAMRRATYQDISCNLFKRGIVIECIGKRLSYLKFLMGSSNAKNKAKAEHIYNGLHSIYKNSHTKTPIFVAIVDDDGVMYISSTGVLLDSSIDLKSVHVDGIDAYSRIRDYLVQAGMDEKDINDSLLNMSIRKVPVVDVHVQPTLDEVKQAVSLLGMLLTIRGFHVYERSATNVISEWNLVAQPLLSYIKDASFTSYELPWSISTFKGLNLSVDDKLRANIVAPYLTCNLGVISTSASSAKANNVRFITALKDGKWTLANGTYAVQIGSERAYLDPALNDMIMAALAMDKAGLDAVAKQILEAAAIYGKACGDGNTWATSLYCEWLGITGLIGGLAINIG